MGNRDIRGKNLKKPKKKDLLKSAKTSVSAPTPSPIVPVVKKPRKDTWPEE